MKTITVSVRSRKFGYGCTTYPGHFDNVPEQHMGTLRQVVEAPGCGASPGTSYAEMYFYNHKPIVGVDDHGTLYHVADWYHHIRNGDETVTLLIGKDN